MNYKFKKNSFKKKSEVKPLSYKAGLMLFLCLVLIGFLIGAAIATYVFFGAITLAGLIALIESNKYLKYVALKGNRLLDVLIFTGTLYAMGMYS